MSSSVFRSSALPCLTMPEPAEQASKEDMENAVHLAEVWMLLLCTHGSW
jgi:hypothetical protein